MHPGFLLAYDCLFKIVLLLHGAGVARGQSRSGPLKIQYGLFKELRSENAQAQYFGIKPGGCLKVPILEAIDDGLG